MNARLTHALLASVSLFVLLLTSIDRVAADDAEEPKHEPTVISLRDGEVKLEAPAAWEAKKPTFRIIDFEFSVPPVEGDENPGRVTVMGAGGDVEQNIQRWIDQFEQPDGSDTKDKAKIEKKEIQGQEVHIVSITGTYKDRPGGGPNTNTPIVLRENYRMLSAIIVTKESGHYFIKLYGPLKTVDAQEEAFHKMLETLQVKS